VLDNFLKLPRHKHTAHAENVPSGTAPPTLTSKNSFETLTVEESLDSDEDKSFKLDSGDELHNNSGESNDLEPITNSEVCFCCSNSKHLSNILVACQCSTKEDGHGSQSPQLQATLKEGYTQMQS
jgi:hypothetical protein